MKHQKAFTLTELIVSFALLSILSLALFRTVLSIQRIQKQNIYINEFKALTVVLNNEIQNDFNNDKITNVTECGNNCYNIMYEKKGNVRLSIDKEDNVITYGNIKEKLPNDYTMYDDIKIKQYTSNTGGFNSYIALTIPIKSALDSNMSGLKYMYIYDSTGGYELDVPTINNRKCTFNGELVQGATYTDGQYTYKYKQQGTGKDTWGNINIDGWGVMLTDKDSTDPVTTRLCSTINGKPIVAMSYMFYLSQAKSVDLSSFNTSKVYTMWDMFRTSEMLSLDLRNFDTSNVTNMAGMFSEAKVRTLDLSNFDTSKVVNMPDMFSGSHATSINMSSFDTSNVIDMHSMFNNSNVKTIDVSNFNTSKVQSMSWMFNSLQAVKTLDLSNFDTSKVSEMTGMFQNSTYLESIDLNSFDTSSLTNMDCMFCGTESLKIIDLSSFDTSKVTNFDSMYWSTGATIGWARTQADADRLNTGGGKPENLVFRVKNGADYLTDKYNDGE